MSSPYPWYYNFVWLRDYFAPSTKNPTDLVGLPLRAKFSDEEATHCIAFAGDLMCMQSDRIPDVHESITRIFAGADLVVINCEAPVMFEEARPFARYVGHFAMAEAFLFGFLERLGVPANKAVLSVANNHMADQGTDGLRSTVERIEKNGATVIGSRLEDDTPLVTNVDLDGRTVGFVAWSDWLNSEHRFTEGARIFRAPDIVGQSLRTSEHDLLIATPHWEYEFRHFPRAETRTRARALVAAGVDLIVGHHPHVLMPLERIDDALCLYSIGNLNGPALKRIAWPVRLGAVLTVGLGASGVVGYELHPFAQRRDSDLHVELLPLDASPEAQRMHERLAVVTARD